MLKWEGPDARGVRRAYDERAMYVITVDASGGFVVGYFPSPGPECIWASNLATVEAAMVEAENCAAHVAGLGA